MLKRISNPNEVNRPLDYSLTNFAEEFFDNEVDKATLLSRYKVKKISARLNLPKNCIREEHANGRKYTAVAFETAPVLSALLLGLDRVPKVKDAEDFRKYISVVLENINKYTLYPGIEANSIYRRLVLTEAFIKRFVEKIAMVLMIALTESGDEQIGFLQSILKDLEDTSEKYLLDHPAFSAELQGSSFEINKMLLELLTTYAPQSSEYLELDDQEPCYEKITHYSELYTRIYKNYRSQGEARNELESALGEARTAYSELLNKQMLGIDALPPLQVLIDQMDQGRSDEEYRLQIVDYLMASCLPETVEVPLKKTEMTILLDKINTGSDIYEQEMLNKTVAKFAHKGAPLLLCLQNIGVCMQCFNALPPQLFSEDEKPIYNRIAVWLNQIDWWKHYVIKVSKHSLFWINTILPTDHVAIESYLSEQLTGFEPFDKEKAYNKIYPVAYAIAQFGIKIDRLKLHYDISERLTGFKKWMERQDIQIIWGDSQQRASFLKGLQLLTYAVFKKEADRRANTFMRIRARNRKRLQGLKVMVMQKESYDKISQKLSNSIYEFIFENYSKEDLNVLDAN